MPPFPKPFAKIIPHADRFDVVFVLFVFGLAGVGIYGVSGSAAIALVSAVTASVAIYQIRKPDDTKRPSVRPAFKTNEDGKHMDFGLRNYGPGAALYLQVEVTLANSGDSILKIEPRDHPLHLREEEFIGFVHDNRRPNGGLLTVLNDAESDEEKLDEMVYLYFSYVSVSGVRVPETLPDKPKRDDETILEDLKSPTEKPRRMKLSEIRQHCLDNMAKDTEPEIRH